MDTRDDTAPAGPPASRDAPRDPAHLHVLIANEGEPRLQELATVVVGLGHEVVATDTAINRIGPLTARYRPDVAIVGVGRSGEHALRLIGKIVHEACCPVITVLHENEPAFVHAAAKRGVFACLTGDDPSAMQSAIEVVLARFDEFRHLQGAFGRRAVIERAKGILMERHHISEQEAFALLSRHSQTRRQKIGDVALAVEQSHTLLPAALEADSDRGNGEASA